MGRASWYTPPTDNFVQLRNEMLRNPDLSWGAKGLLGAMMTYPPAWRFRQSHLETQSPEGRQALRTKLRELLAKRYIVRVQIRNRAGRVTGGDYRVSDTPRPTDGIPVGGRAAVGKAVAGVAGGGEAAATNTKLMNTDRKKIDSTNTKTHKTKSMSPDGDAFPGRVSGSRSEDGAAPPRPPDPAEAAGGSALATWDGGGSGSAGAPTVRVTRANVQAVLDAYNERCGTLPKAVALNDARERQIKALIRRFGVDETIALMGVAASEVAHDPFWRENRYGLDNLLAGQKLIGKFEAARARGTTDRSTDRAKRYRAALEGI